MCVLNLIKPYCLIIAPNPLPSQYDLYGQIEQFGRICYKSEENITLVSAKPFVSKLLKLEHEAVLEHFNFSVKFVIDRGILQELRTHRIASFLAESTRWCNYDKKGFTFIIPPWVNITEGPHTLDATLSSDGRIWYNLLDASVEAYKKLLELGWTPQKARSVLPNSLKTEVIATMNIRQWRHVLKLRTAPDAHPQMQEIMQKLLIKFKLAYPELFEEIGE